MADDLATVQADSSILDAGRAMADGGRAPPAVLQGRLVAGMVSVRDPLPALADAVRDDDVVAAPSGTRLIVRSN